MKWSLHTDAAAGKAREEEARKKYEQEQQRKEAAVRDELAELKMRMNQ